MTPSEAAQEILRQLTRHPSTNEAKRRELFVGHFESLYPEFAWQISEYALGAEEPVRTRGRRGEKVTTGWIDTRKGKLLIEYKSNLLSSSQEQEALDELARYVAGIVNKEGPDAVAKCLATDVLTWREYEFTISEGAVKGRVTPQQISIDLLGRYAFSETDAERFVQTTKRLLFEDVPLVARGSILVDFFGIGSKRYASFKSKLEDAWQTHRETPEGKLGLTLWSEYLENCFDKGAIPDEPNYLDHVYLVILARMITGSTLSSPSERATVDFPKRCITGEIFETADHRVEHFVEDDFFRWIKTESALKMINPALEQLQNDLQRFDFRSAKKLHLFVELYEQIMPPRRRAELGEVFTPSWLVDMIVKFLPRCERKGVRVLDPACGTGSFLRSVITRKLEHLPQRWNVQRKLESVLSDICGQDVNPVAVIISKATIMLTLSELLKQSEEPVEIPVYLCDSLFLPKHLVHSGFGERFLVDFDGTEIEFPGELFEGGTESFDRVVQRAHELAKQLVKGSVSRQDCIEALSLFVEHVEKTSQFDSRTVDQLRLASERLLSEMYERISKRRNNVWTFVLRNTYRPSLLKSNFDLVMSNPPWLAMSSLTGARYKEQLRKLAEDYNILPRGPSAHHFEIATVFAIHCVKHYLRTHGRFAFVLPYVILRGDQHDPLRRSMFRKLSPLSAEYIWELEEVPKLFKRPACVLFGKSSWDAAGFPTTIRSRIIIGDPDARFSSRERVLDLRILGNKSSYQEGARRIREHRYYWSLFRQGADLMPRQAVIVDLTDNENARVLSIATSESETKNPQNKPPFNRISLRGTIESDFLFCTVKSDYLLPFVVAGFCLAALPVQKDSGRYRLITHRELALNGHNHALRWFELVDDTLRGLQRKTLESWLNRKNKLTDQDSEPIPYLVVYGAGGSNVCSAVISTESVRFPFVNDQTLYTWAAPDEDEAWYVCGMLNSDPINQAIKEYQPKGKFGEQHVHKLPLSLIPRFDLTDSLHLGVSREARRTAAIAAQKLKEDRSYLDMNKALSSRRLRFRRQLQPGLTELNKSANEILNEDGSQ